MPSPSGSGLRSALRRASFGALLLGALCGCSSREPDPVTPFPLGRALIYGEGAGARAIDVTPGCQSAACQAVRERCGERAYAEVILDRGGAIADVACYRGDAPIRELGPAQVTELGDEPGTILLLDARDDGPDVLGDVRLSADDVVLFGAGASVSELGGGLGIDASGATVRGVAIAGDVTIEREGATLSLVEIRGQLFINADDVTLTESVVHGRVHVAGSRALLVRNLLGASRALSGAGLKCNLNQRFADADADGVIGEDEVGVEVICG